MKKQISKIILILIGVSDACGEKATNFDDEMLKSQGIDVAIAQQFSLNVRFLPGKQKINIYVNNKYKKNLDIVIDDNGSPCLTADLLENIGLILPNIRPYNSKCLSLSELWPTSEIISKTTQQALWFFVPENAVNPVTQPENNAYIYGGKAALINYTAHYMGSSGKTRQDMYFVNTEAGFNFNNWILRSAQMYNRLSQHNHFTHQYAYAQTTLEKQKKNIQIGQVNLQNSVMGTAKVMGVQIIPENRLESKIFGGAIVTGIAAESSMVEIYQLGQLIYQTAVPPGPFELTQFTLLNRTSDLRVKLNGVNGNIQEFTIPASTFLPGSSIGDTGYSFGLGRYDDNHSQNHPWVTSLSKGWAISPRLGVKTGGVVTSNYYAIGLNSSSFLTPELTINLLSNLSHSKKESQTGTMVSANLNYSINESFALGINTVIQSATYHYLSDTVNDQINDKINNKQRQYGGNLNWSSPAMGTVVTSFGRNYDFMNKYQDFVSLSWSKTIYDNYLLNTSVQRNYTQNNSTEDAFYFRLSIPLEKSNISTWFNHNENNQRLGIRYQSYNDRDQNWGVGYEYNDKQHYQSISANINQVTPYTQISGNVRRSNDAQSDWGGALSGGIAWVQEGLLLSPYSIKETFGVAKAGERSGIRLDSRGGTTWTNMNGYAILPTLEPYHSNAISIDTKTLGRQSDILNAYKAVTPAKGSIVPVLFTVIENRRLMMDVSLNGKPLPTNSIIRDSAGNFLTLVVRKGEIFIGDATPEMLLNVETPEKQFCSIRLNLSKEREPDVVYEKLSVSCLP